MGSNEHRLTVCSCSIVLTSARARGYRLGNYMYGRQQKEGKKLKEGQKMCENQGIKREKKKKRVLVGGIQKIAREMRCAPLRAMREIVGPRMSGYERYIPASDA